MIFVNDPAGQTLYHDPAWKNLTGQDAAQALGIGWLERIHHEDRALVEDTHFRAMEARTEYAMQYRLLAPDDSAQWVYVSAKASMGPPDQTFIGFLGGLTVLTTGESEMLKPFRTIGRESNSTSDGSTFSRKPAAPANGPARLKDVPIDNDSATELRDRVHAAIEHSRQARRYIGSDCAHRTRVTLDMVLLELAKELPHAGGSS